MDMGGVAVTGDEAKPMSRKTGKNIEKARAAVESRPYKLDEAVPLLQKVKFAKFDETVDLTMRLGVDPKHADQMVRGTVVLPHGLGKMITVSERLGPREHVFLLLFVIALLAFLIALLGTIGTVPALLAIIIFKRLHEPEQWQKAKAEHKVAA